MSPTSRLLRGAALAVACTLVLPASAAHADAEGATIDKTGWWSRANTTTATPAGPVTVPPPPGIPEGDLAVGRLGDEPTALAAVGIQPDVGPGATVQSFTLTLREDPEADANQGGADAAIVACPITGFWAGGENGTWDTQPEHDCGAAAVAGVRDEDGTWVFDLAPIGALWFDTFGTIRADGVVLLADPDPEGEPSSFQVVWRGGDEIDVQLEAEAAPAGEDPFATPPSPDPPSDAGLSSGPGGGGSSLFAPPRVTTPPSLSTSATPTSAPVADDGPADGGDDEVAAPATPAGATGSPIGGKAGQIAGNLPGGSVLLVPLALATLLAMSYWLGPAGQPSTTDRRGGVSRALAVRARATQER